MSDYTPSTDEVLDCFLDGAAGEFIAEDFRSWRAAHDAEVRADQDRKTREAASADILAVITERPADSTGHAWMHTYEQDNGLEQAARIVREGR